MSVLRTAIFSGMLLAGVMGPQAQVQAAQLDAQLRSAAMAQQPAVIETLRDLVTVESGSTDHEGVGKLMAYLDMRLSALDAKVERVASATGGPDLVRGTFTGHLVDGIVGMVDIVGVGARSAIHRIGTSQCVDRVVTAIAINCVGDAAANSSDIIRPG